MRTKYIILYHSSDLKSFEEIEAVDKSYRCEDKVISLKDAFIFKKEGKKVTFPKSTIRYDFVIEPYRETYSVRTGRPLEKPGVHCPIRRLNNQSIGICFIGNFNEISPTREMLETAAVLIKGLMYKYEIAPKKILPERYFNKSSDNPGLLFNVKRFVREYLT